MYERDDALLGEFLAECREHLADIENDLLTIEEGGADIDEQLVNKVFRAAHSIKGGAGFFNLVKIQELGHRTENVLDMVRSREIVPTPEVVNILLLAFDRLREMINQHHQSNGGDIDEIMGALSGLASSFLPPEEKASINREVTIDVPESAGGIKVSEFDLVRARREGCYLYLLQIDLIHDVQRRGKTPLDVIRALLDCGSIFDAQVDLTSAGTLEDEPTNELILRVIYASVVDPIIMAVLVEIPTERIRVLEAPASASSAGKQDKGTVPAAGPGPAGPLAETDPRVCPAPTPSSPATVPPLAAEPPPLLVLDSSQPVATSLAPRPVSITETQAADAGRSPGGGEATLRVQVGLLETLMNLAGELVLGRNQLSEAIARRDLHAIRAGGQRLNLVTSELQEAVMLTRMQPIGNLFGKFPRLVRDLSRELGKDIHLELNGRDVELDETLLEGLSDPLTHMVRNAVDHGVESPETRAAQGKPAGGTVRLQASHQAGQVVVEIADDGKGIDPEKIADAALSRGLITREQMQAMSDTDKRALVFLPGLSTAEKVSDVSGRGVGMDVVKTNLDRLGGQVEIDSVAGRGTTFRIKLPLTLAIIPSLLVSVGEERFAIPQVNVSELLRISADQIGERIEVVGDAEVLVLRSTLIPVVELSTLLGLDDEAATDPRRMRERRAERGSDLRVVVVSAGPFLYGLVVEELHDSLEIVVKPLGRHLKGLRECAGATILGNGRVSLILDAAGLAGVAGLTSMASSDRARELALEAQREESAENDAYLVFDNGPDERCAVPLSLVTRVERIKSDRIEWGGGRRTMQYRGASLPLVTLADAGAGAELGSDRELVVIVFHLGGKEIGLVAAMPVDVLETSAAVDTTTLRRPGISGSAIIRDRTTLVLDIRELVESAWPGWIIEHPGEEEAVAGGDGPLLLLAEDSEFFRAQARRYLEEGGYRVVAAEDGEAAWEQLENLGDAVSLVITDVEMPRLTGLELTQRIRADERFAAVPVIALSSLAGEDDISRARELGVDDYQVKIDREHLLASVRSLLGEVALAA
jgi:two-component system chemotaxis sensor kinase CheA